MTGADRERALAAQPDFRHTARIAAARRKETPMTATPTTPPPVTMTLEEILGHDRDRLATLTLATGEKLALRTVLEVGEGWLLIVTGYGESETKLYVRTAAIATATLR